MQSRLGVTSEIENGAGELHHACMNVSQRMKHWLRDDPDTGAWSLLGSSPLRQS